MLHHEENCGDFIEIKINSLLLASNRPAGQYYDMQQTPSNHSINTHVSLLLPLWCDGEQATYIYLALFLLVATAVIYLFSTKDGVSCNEEEDPKTSQERSAAAETPYISLPGEVGDEGHGQGVHQGHAAGQGQAEGAEGEESLLPLLGRGLLLLLVRHQPPVLQVVVVHPVLFLVGQVVLSGLDEVVELLRHHRQRQQNFDKFIKTRHSSLLSETLHGVERAFIREFEVPELGSTILYGLV
mmetsp:Transcript_56641/g.82882  ORF Transcript_56641/g.82882 Transcript_56641/m.82882 type:complete len:241 (+) Transcript_56641:143-865(+)